MTSVTIKNLQRPSNLSLDRYEHDVQLYTIELEGIVSFETLRKLGIARLSILKLVTDMAAVHSKRLSRSYLDELVVKIRKQGLELFADLYSGNGSCFNNETERRLARWADHVSFNAVCLALCQQYETQEWLLEAEEQLLQWRVIVLSNEEIRDFMRINSIELPVVDEEEKLRLRDQLIISVEEPERFSETIFFKVPCVDALDVIVGNKVHIALGVAYLTTPLLRCVICRHFYCHLETQFEVMCYSSVGNKNCNAFFSAAISFLDKIREVRTALVKFGSWTAHFMTNSDPRLNNLIEDLLNVHESMKPTSWITATRVEDLDALAATSYPPCMRKLHEALKANSHLRNMGRLQYTLFLKAIGVPAEATLDFYRTIFTRKISTEDFNKEYAYCFRHMYGLEGGKKNYQLYDCNKIGESRVGVNEYHGCPFTLGDIEDLHKMLTRWKVPSTDRSKIDRLTRERKYGEACSAYFEATHGFSAACPIINPTDFYKQSSEFTDFRETLRVQATANSDKSLGSSDEDDVENSEAKLAANSKDNDKRAPAKPSISHASSRRGRGRYQRDVEEDSSDEY